MEIIVCIKQVPDTTDVKINPETNTLIREGVASIINPFDMYAIEEAIRLKEKFGGTVTVITMGPPQAEQALREAISFGVDKAILLTDRVFAGSDTWSTSLTLSAAIGNLDKFDIILCGKQASDGDTAQVGPGISTHLDIPQITFVRKIESVNLDKRKLVAQRLLEEGHQRIEVSLPCLLTVVKEINEPRMPSLKGKMRAKKADIIQMDHSAIDLDPDDIGLKGSPTQVIKIFIPPSPEGGEIFENNVDEGIQKITEVLKEKANI